MKKVQTDLKKHIFKLINNPVFGEALENPRKNRNIKLVTTGHKETI